MTAAQAAINYLNDVGLPVPGAARANVPGTDQRHAMITASTVDLDEAYLVGRKAVEIAITDGSGYMATILRQPGRDLQRHASIRSRWSRSPTRSASSPRSGSPGTAST